MEAFQERLSKRPEPYEKELKITDPSDPIKKL